MTVEQSSDPNEIPAARPPEKATPSAWSRILASLLFSLAAFEMLALYSLVHWRIMFDREAYPDGVSAAVCEVLSHLYALRIVFAVLAMVWAVWAYRARPHWEAAVVFALAVGALLSVFLMT